MTESADDHEGHQYIATIVWDGNTGDGTSSYTDYGRQHRIVIHGKPDILGTADPVFHGDPARHNPEDLFLASLSACHMLSYLALCARSGVNVLSYEDEARGRVVVHADGGGRFEQVTLHPRVTIEGKDKTALAMRLHDTAHKRCFIANSCSVPVNHEPTVEAG